MAAAEFTPEELQQLLQLCETYNNSNSNSNSNSDNLASILSKLKSFNLNSSSTTSSSLVVESGGPPPPPPPAPMPLDLDAGGPPPPPLGPPGPPGAPPPPAGSPVTSQSQNSGMRKNPIKPSMPMKQFFWTKIPESKIRKTIFDQASDEGVLDILDKDTFEKAFCKPKPKARNNQSSDSSSSSSSSSTTKKTAVKLLDAQRSQNISIMLSSIKDDVKPAQIVKYILETNAKAISRDFLVSLLQNAPKTEEMEVLQSYSGPVEELAVPEQFLIELLKIPRVTSRLEAWNMSRKAGNLLSEINDKLTLLHTALEEIYTGKDPSEGIERSMIQAVLELILALGNYMNGGTPRGCAAGFKIDALQKLYDVDATDGKFIGVESSSSKKTLMHFIAFFLDAEMLDLFDWPSCLPSVKSAGKIEYSQLKGEVSELDKIISFIHVELDAIEDMNNNFSSHGVSDAGDKFRDTMTNFLEEFEPQVKEIKSRIEDLQNYYVQVASFFGEEDVTQLAMDEFIRIFSKFIVDFEKAVQDNAKDKLKKEAMLTNDSRTRIANEVKMTDLPPMSSSNSLDNIVKQSGSNHSINGMGASSSSINHSHSNHNNNKNGNDDNTSPTGNDIATTVTTTTTATSTSKEEDLLKKHNFRTTVETKKKIIVNKKASSSDFNPLSLDKLLKRT